MDGHELHSYSYSTTQVTDGLFVFAVYIIIVNDMKTSDLKINSCSSDCSNGSKGTLAELQFGHHCSTCGHSSLWPGTGQQ